MPQISVQPQMDCPEINNLIELITGTVHEVKVIFQDVKITVKEVINQLENCKFNSRMQINLINDIMDLAKVE